MNQGYIKIYRKLADSAVFQDPELLKLWMLCLLKAAHKRCFVTVDGIKNPIELQPGQFVTGRFALHRDYYPRKKKNMKSPKTLWEWLQILKNMGNLSIESSNKFSIVSITNWNSYQIGECENVQQACNRGAADVQQTCTNKNEKECKEDNTPHKQIIDLYHSILPELSRVKTWTEKRKKALRARWKEDPKHQNLEWWEGFFKHVRKCGHLMGKNDRGWQATLEWLITEGNFVKVIEGNYD